MRSRSFAVDEDGPLDLEVAWTGVPMRDFTVRFRGEEIGSVDSLKAHKQGVTFALPDGRTLFARWRQGLSGAELTLLVDGRPLLGSSTHPRTRVKAAAVSAGVIAAVNGAIGLYVVIGANAEAKYSGLPMLLFGTIYATLAWLMWRRRSRAAIWAAIVLLALDSWATVEGAFAGDGGTGPSAVGVIMRVVFFAAFFRALPAARELQLRRPKLAPSAAGGSTGAPAPVPVVTIVDDSRP